MGQRIGTEPIGFVRNVEVNINVPDLLTVLSTSEEHSKHVQAIQILSSLLNTVAVETIRINDPKLMDLMFKMKLLKIEGGDFEDI